MDEVFRHHREGLPPELRFVTQCSLQGYIFSSDDGKLPYKNPNVESHTA